MAKTYKVLSACITGKHGRIMHKGDCVSEAWLINHEQHVRQQHIEEVVAKGQPAPAPTTTEIAEAAPNLKVKK